MSEALRFLVLAELVGLAALPLAHALYGRLPGGSAGLAKPVGLLFVTWVAWLVGSVAPYGIAVAVGAFGVLVAVGLLLRHWPYRERHEDPARRRLAWCAEGVFLVAFAAMLLVRSHAPDVWGTEQPMDMALIATAGRSGGFPPDSPWMAGQDLDYYYLGHLAMALITRLAVVGPDEGYNVALALVYALSASATFTLGAGLAPATRRTPVRYGLAAVALMLVLGNLASAEELRAASSLREYDWFATSRVVPPGLINEFPAFSFLLGDLHAHVIAIPFTLLGVATAIGVLRSGPRPRDALAGGGVTGLLYAMNAWSTPVIGGLILLSLVARVRIRRQSWGPAAAWTGTFLLVAVLAVLPFLGTFDQPTGGIGLVEDRRTFPQFLGDQVRLHGLLLWLVGAAFVGALLRARRPGRLLAWSAVALALLGSALAGPRLTGTLLLAVLGGVALLRLLDRRTPDAERAPWLLIAAGLGCLIVPELVYVRDEFDGGELARMNTVFKLGYEAWMLLALAGAGALAFARDWLGRRGARAWAAVAAVLAVAALSFPLAGSYARTGGFAGSPRLEGLGWLARTAPGDVAAIDWLRSNTSAGDVLLESAGEDYSAFGHARMSTFTGIPTVLGWAGHEVQWGHDPGNRRELVDRLYRTQDSREARALLERFDVRFVVVGPLERTDHGDAGIAKWDRLGRRVFDREGTTIWEVG